MLVMMAAQELANGISYSGHVYAMTRAGRHLTPAGDLQEIFGGMEQVGPGSSWLGYARIRRCLTALLPDSGEVHEESGRDVRPDPSDPDPAQDQDAPFQPGEHEVGPRAVTHLRQRWRASLTPRARLFQVCPQCHSGENV